MVVIGAIVLFVWNMYNIPWRFDGFTFTMWDKTVFIILAFGLWKLIFPEKETK